MYLFDLDTVCDASCWIIANDFEGSRLVQASLNPTHIQLCYPVWVSNQQYNDMSQGYADEPWHVGKGILNCSLSSRTSRLAGSQTILTSSSSVPKHWCCTNPLTSYMSAQVSNKGGDNKRIHSVSPSHSFEGNIDRPPFNNAAPVNQAPLFTLSFYQRLKPLSTSTNATNES